MEQRKVYNLFGGVLVFVPSTDSWDTSARRYYREWHGPMFVRIWAKGPINRRTGAMRLEWWPNKADWEHAEVIRNA